MHIPHPWRRLRDLPEVTLAWHDDGPDGWFCHDTMVLSIRRGMSQAERRSTVAHELQHVHRGRVWAAWAAREEAACEVAAARDLIDLHKLGETLAWAHCLAEAAEELWVDEQLLVARLSSLHPTERAYLRKRLEHLGGEEHGGSASGS